MTPHENRFRLALARATKTSQNANNSGGYNGTSIGQRIERKRVASSGRKAELHNPMRRAVRIS